MRQRKRLVAAIFLLTVGLGTWCCWPQPNWEARQAFDVLRDMLEPIAADDETQRKDSALDETRPIQFEITVINVNRTDATAGLFAETVPTEKVVLGKLKAPQRFLETLQALTCASVIASPRLATLQGQCATIVMGQEVPAVSPGNVVTYRPIGTLISMTPVDIDRDRVKLRFKGEFSRVRGIRTLATPSGPVDQPDIETLSVEKCVTLQAGETLVIGGLARNNKASITFRTPVLGELPRVGSWFHFTRQREIEEEFVMIVTPRLGEPGESLPMRTPVTTSAKANPLPQGRRLFR